MEDARALLEERGMTVIDDVDMDAFRAAGMQAYEVLGLSDAVEQVHSEIGR